MGGDVTSSRVRRFVYALSLAVAAACARSEDGRYVAPAKVTPSALHAGSGDSVAPWALFDRDTSTTWSPDLQTGTTVLRISLPRPTRLAYLKVFGPSAHSLRVTTLAGDAVQGLERVDLSGLREGWNALRFAQTEPLEEVVLHLTPASSEASVPPELSELELWSLDFPARRAVDGSTIGDLLTAPDATFPGHLDHAGASPEIGVLAAPSAGGGDGTQCATFRFAAPRPPAVYRRAWLAYRADGAFRPFVMTRALNTQPMRRGQWLDKQAEPGWFVEPLDPEALHAGVNQYDFCLPSSATTAVAVRDVRFFGELEQGTDLVEAAAIAPAEGDATAPAPELLDSENAEPRTVAAGERVLLSFGRLASPDLIIVESPTARWRLSCLDASGEASPLEVAAGDPRDGLIAFFVDPNAAPASCAGLALTPATGAGAELTHVAVVASGARRRIDWPRITLASPPEHFGRVAWVDGWANAPSELGGSVGIDVDGSDSGTAKGVFGRLLSRGGDASSVWPVSVTARFADGSKLTQEFVLGKNGDIDPGAFAEKKPGGMSDEEKAAHFGKPGQTTGADIDGKSGGSVKLGTDVGVDVPPGALNGGKTTKITITHLTAAQVPKLDPGMFNVTAPDAHGYELLPHGQKFEKPVEITLPYDLALIPPGYQPKDVHAYYFDTDTQHWKRLSRADVDTSKKTTRSLSDHFTVMINAVVVAPEHPQIRSFNPNEIRDIQAADPGAGITLIEPPGASSRGDATLSYPLELPPGRRGLEPRLALTYDSSRGNGWLGMGWDLPMRAITVDTRWGSPRYTKQTETENYLLEGEQLTPLSHRGPVKQRSEDTTVVDGKTVKIFHTRVEGGFQRIIRRGSDPTEYFWEVIDKTGTRYFYGADPGADKPTSEATLGSAEGIFQWALRAVVDRHGNSIRYEYAHAHHPGYAGSIFPGDELYPTSISYTCLPGQTTGPYRVSFLRESQLALPLRPDVIVDGRGRFKRVTADRLARIEVRFAGEVTAAWELRYQEGAFHKSLLAEIRQLGAGDMPFDGNRHRFSYFDEIREDPSDKDSAYKGYDGQQAWSAGADGVKGNTTVPPVFGAVIDMNASLLGASETSSSGEHFYLGFNPGPPSKQGSYGFKLGSGSSSGNGRLVLVDLDGDGLPDKVFDAGSGSSADPRFRRNLSGPRGAPGFDTNQTLTPGGLPRLGADRSNMTSYGFEGYPGPAQLMLNVADSFSESTSYFSDVNGDGLPDFVNDGHVLFNVPDAAGTPKFLQDQAGASAAPLPILLAPVDKTDLVPDYSALAQTRKDQFPLVDVVRRWHPPANGFVSISGAVKRLVGDSNADDVHVSIWRQAISGAGVPTELWSASISGSDTSPKVPSGVSNVEVATDQFLFFRVSSVNDVKNDVVEWDPVIQYSLPVLKDANELDQTKYQASSDFVLAGRNDVYVRVPFKGQMKVVGSLAKPKTTDDVLIYVKKNDAPVPGTQKQGTWDSTVPLSIDQGFSVQPGDVLRLMVETPSPIDLAKLLGGMSMDVQYVSAEDAEGKPIATIGADGKALFSFAIPYDASIFSGTLPSVGAPAFQVPYLVQTDAGTVTVTPTLKSSQPQVGTKVRFTVKRPGALASQHVFDLKNSGEQSVTLQLGVTKNDLLFFDFSASELIDPTKNQITHAVTVQEPTKAVVTWPSYLRLPEEQDRCSRRYRGWSVGALNGALAPYGAAVPDAFCAKQLPDISALQNPPKNIQDVASQSIVLRKNVVTVDLVPLPKGLACPPESISCEKPSDPVWSVGDGRTYLSKNKASPSRLGAGDIGVPDNTSIVALYAPQRISASKQTAVDVGVGAGPLGVSASKSTGTSYSVVDYMDMNGDGYPDVVGHGGIQYTTARGNLAERIPNLTRAREGSTTAYGAGVNGNPSEFFSNSKGRAGAASATTTKDAALGAQLPSLGVGVSLGASVDTSDAGMDLHDVNGDGLPDRVIHPQSGPGLLVQLNLGYSFGPPEPLGPGVVSTGNGSEVNGGASLSFNDRVYGFAGGLSGSKSKTYIRQDSGIPGAFQEPGQTLLDVNGDGLPDQVAPQAGHFLVAINTGAGFATPVLWKNVPGDANDSSTLKLGGGGYFTYAIGPLCLPSPTCYIILNPGADASTGMNRQEAVVTDLDGDGHPDHLTSTSDGQVKVARNRTGKTNLLSRVARPMGAVIDLDYARSGNTRAHPQSRWVLSRVSTFDGQAGDWRPQNPGADFELTTFSYDEGIPDDGRYDRFEREFYGYSKVIETEHDTRGFSSVPAAFSAPYRTTTRFFHNSSFFDKGLLAREVVESAAAPGSPAPRFTEVENFYVMRDVATGAVLTTPQALHDTLSPVFPELTTAVRRVHEGDPTAGIVTLSLHEYDPFGNVTKLVDSGDPSTTGDDFVATMTYTGHGGVHAGCAANYIVGLADTIAVTDVAGKLLRRREAQFNCSTGDLDELRQTISTGSVAVSNFLYDDVGNLSKVQGPDNLHNKRYALAFGYDAQTRSHVTSVTDSFGYVSTSTYDLRFGVVQNETDPNASTISRSYDAFGRLASLVGPYEQGTGHATIVFHYSPEAPVPFAVTRHIDTFRNPQDPIETVLFTDGLKRVLQTKKDATIHQGKGAPPQDMMIVSGRVTFDHVGRTIEAFYPTLEAKGASNIVFNQLYDGIAPTHTTYDVMNRVVSTTLPDNTTTTHFYSLEKDKQNHLRLATLTKDALSNAKVTYRDIRDQIRAIKELNGAQAIWTLYEYDPVQQLVAVQDDKNNLTKVAYDLLGRRTMIDNPDTGKTQMKYDAASNLTEKITANLAAKSKAIVYDYEYNRLKSITYPDHPENDVAYEYGPPNATNNRAGRITQVTDESGKEERWYGKLGEITQETKTVASETQGKSENSPEVWTTKYVYDTWGRLQQLTYPDKEVLTYKYDSGGLPHSVKGVKLGNEYPYVQKLEYDKFEQRAYLFTGNGVEESFSYNPKDRRLAQKTAGDFQDLQYQYDLVGNITALDNKVPKGKPSDMGGPVEQTFKYDNLYRLTSASGVWHFAPNKSDEQTLSMAYDSIHNITQKTQGHQVVTPGGAIVPQKKTSYAHTYKFSGAQPHAPTQIGDFKYFYDKNGNQTGWDDLKSGQKRVISWDEENRIQAISDNGHTTDFKYNDAGERVIKRGEQGETAYVNQFWTVRNRSVGTKHVFVGETRVSSKVVPGDDHVNPGNDKWAGVLGQWWLHRSAQGWANGKNTVKNPHYAGNAMPDNLPEDNFVFFYHPDHLGSTEYVTDAAGELYEHVQYFAFGETWVSEHKNTETLPYLFTSKELDEETGLYYFGARYYDPRTSVWQNPDPLLTALLTQKPVEGLFESTVLARYSYSRLNPLRFFDPNGLQEAEFQGGGGAPTRSVTGSEGASATGRQMRRAGPVTRLDVERVVGGFVAGTVCAAAGCSEAAAPTPDTPSIPAMSEGDKIAQSAIGAAIAVLGKFIRINLLRGAPATERIVAGELKVLKTSRLKGIDAEKFKMDIVGKAEAGRFNIAKDKAGNVFLTPVKKGTSQPVPTGHTIDELRKLYPKE